jgi:tripartite-type tricarboxylate transporter receptor subunit TctC
MRRRSLLGLATGLATTLAMPALAFPERTVTLATGFAPGGSTDVTARLLADRLGPALGGNARVVVENRPGAAGIVAGEWLRRQAPDGHVLMLVEASSHALAPNAVPGFNRYDAVADFTHVAMVGSGPMILVAQPGFPARDPARTVALLREARADTMPFASSGVASMPHLSAEMFAATIGLGGRFPHVPYRSGGLMVESIARGETQWGVAVLASAAGQVRDGRVLGLAVTGRERFPAFPDIPTLNEGALPGFDLENWFAVIAPRGLPDGLTAALNRAVTQAISEPQLRERLLVAGVAPWTRPNRPEDAQAFFAAEQAKFREVVARTGVRLEP